MPKLGDNPEYHSSLSVSTGGFAVLCSLLFLFERLGVAPGVLVVAMVAAITLIAVFTSLTNATITASKFLVADHNEDAASQTFAGSSEVVSATMIVLLVTGVSPWGNFYLLLAVALVLGVGVGGSLFSKRLRQYGANSVPDFLSQVFSSASIRVVSSLTVSIICLLLLYAEVRLSGMFIAMQFDVSFGQVSALVLLLAAFTGLMGGLLSTTRVQIALFLIVLITTIAPTLWLAKYITGWPIPQLWIAGIVDINQGLANLGQLGPELNVAGLLVGNANYLLPVMFICGFASLPHFLNRHLIAGSEKIAQRGRRCVPAIAALLLCITPAFYFTGSVEMPVMLQLSVPIAVLAAAFATSAVLLVTVANTMSGDLFSVLSTGQKPPGRQVFLARLLIILTAAGIWYAVSPMELNAVSALLWALVFSAGCMFPAVLAGTQWHRAKKGAVLAGMTGGFLVCTVLFLARETGYGGEIVKQFSGSFPKILGQELQLAAITAIILNFAVIFLFSIAGSSVEKE